MTYLTVYTDGDTPVEVFATDDAAEIAAALKPLDVVLRHWPVVEADGDVLAAYRERVAALTEEEGFVQVDVVALGPDADPETARAARAKFLSEHTHDDDEVRFFASGSGIFYLHVGDRVHAVLCEAGDLLTVPRATTHWFDMGTAPDFAAIRFFHDDDGWVGNFTGDPIASRIPDYDTIAADRKR
ncbi:acireductone dioxygenase apoprotein [Actinocorallia herbida]|uniref:Acireductone dioxygenase n=1 Tax=Actinocorallia herbida TaxID=58109 RepID=A0A3N1CWV3_9ACTN|nr:cupin [Actinocorallia herbida]ROO85779.1 acireductone dioxygenase apoprotein [Actinocorallia herbida]